MRNISKHAVAGLSAALLFAASACGNSENSTAEGDAASVAGAGDASVSDLGADASTADAMSVDVAAGGVEPMTDPALVDIAPIPDPAPAAQEVPAE